MWEIGSPVQRGPIRFISKVKDDFRNLVLNDLTWLESFWPHRYRLPSNHTHDDIIFQSCKFIFFFHGTNETIIMQLIRWMNCKYESVCRCVFAEFKKTIFFFCLSRHHLICQQAKNNKTKKKFAMHLSYSRYNLLFFAHFTGEMKTYTQIEHRTF